MFAESSLTPFPEGANMHPSCPTCFTSLGGARVCPEASPLTTRASHFLTVLWASVRLRTSLGLATLWAEKRPLAQQASLSLQPLGNRDFGRSTLPTVSGGLLDL